MSMCRILAGKSESEKRMGLRPHVVEGFDRNDVFNSSSISGFEFADGTTLTIDELLAKGFDIDGTAGNQRTRWRISATPNSGGAANDETSNVWRAAA